MDSGAMVHISPCMSDFVTLHAIDPHPVKGVGGTSIVAMGIGEIHLHIQGKAKIILENALYVLRLTICLISVSSLAVFMHATITFDFKGVLSLIRTAVSS